MTDGWGLQLLACIALFAMAALLALWRRWFAFARLAVVAQVALILTGWGLAQHPYVIMPDVTFHQSAAPEATLRLLTFALSAGSVLLLPALIFLFRLFTHPETNQDNPP
ncbi:MAG: cytochrome d ubiquinol oxidase subunit II [Prosthecobacter sp.]